MERTHALAKIDNLERIVNDLLKEYEAVRTRCQDLIAERQELVTRLSRLEESLVKETKEMKNLHHERAVTKMVVDDLISSIDRLVEPKECSE